MKAVAKISGEERRAAIIRTARTLFVEKGFNGTTTRELAAAAGVSEALLFKHFPSKEALYAAILTSTVEDEATRIIEHLQTLEPSTATLVFLVRDLVAHVVIGPPDEEARSFFRLIIRSLIDEGEFTRLAIQGPPRHWVEKVAACLQAAQAAGDVGDAPVRPQLGGWFVHQLVTGVMLHSLPRPPIIDYGVSPRELVDHIVRFCLRGMGLKEEALQRCDQHAGGGRGR